MSNISYLFLFFLFCSSVSCQETTQILTLVNPIPTSSTNFKNPHLAVSLSYQHLNNVAGSVLTSETWLRTYVLPYYPASKITHIVVGHNIMCVSHHFQTFDIILHALNNLQHSLIRWGLHTKIHVSPSFSSHCLSPNFTHSLLKPLLHFIHVTNSSYLFNPSDNPNFETLISSNLEFLKKVGFSNMISKVSLLVETPKEGKKTILRRKLAIVIPPLPTPSSEIFPIGEGPLPPLVGPIPSPPTPLSPARSPHHHHPHLLPPCNPWTGTPPPQPTPGPQVQQKLWCVAKPSVPEDTLKEAMDYACGEGGAECDEIQPYGDCYYPDTAVAHASFAFNKYWQKTKNDGGTCGFGGTAMLINSDPSFLHCKFIVN